jgi:hypothetical protein
MVTRLYLDDVRTPVDDSWIVVRSFHEFVEHIDMFGMPYEISFDHDLGWNNISNQPRLSGMDCAKWLVENNYVPDRFYVHSANPVGAENILCLLNNWQAENGLRPNGYKTFWECKIHEDEIY